MTDQIGTGAAIGHRQSLEAKRVLACRRCGAPGVWCVPADDQQRQHFANWPGVVVEPFDPEKPAGGYVGKTCPNCGAGRDGLLISLGEIWHRIIN